jgi:hypothetical protein
MFRVYSVQFVFKYYDPDYNITHKHWLKRYVHFSVTMSHIQQKENYETLYIKLKDFKYYYYFLSTLKNITMILHIKENRNKKYLMDAKIINFDVMVTIADMSFF